VFLKSIHELVMHSDDLTAASIQGFKERLLSIDHTVFPEHPTQIVKHYTDAWWMDPSKELNLNEEPEYHILSGEKMKAWLLQVSTLASPMFTTHRDLTKTW
jgi:hypothetical protein